MSNFVFEENAFDNICYYSKCTYVRVVKYRRIFTFSVQILKYKAKTAILNLVTNTEISCKWPYPSQFFLYISALCIEETLYKNYIPRMYNVCCIILAAHGWTTVRNESLVQIYNGLKLVMQRKLA